MQLDEAERGFSFRLDGPLDMRMGGDGPSAADVVAQASERDLADIIFQLGEERHSRAVARAIVAARGTRSDPDDASAGRDRRARGACAAGHDPSGDAHLSGAAHFRQRGARRTCRSAWRRRACPQSLRAARGGELSFARRSHRQDLSRRAQPHRGRVASPTRRRGAGADLPPADETSDRARRRRDRGQSARAFRQAACGRAQRSAAAPARCRGAAAAHCRRSPM